MESEVTGESSSARENGNPNLFRRYARRHLRFGWWSLLFFLTLGIVLEMLHGFKIGWYLNVSNEARRLMMTLAHAHGTLLSLIHIAAGATIAVTARCSPLWRKFGSPALIGASFSLPGGFLLGGIVIFKGDPGYGVFLVPVGAILLFAGVYFTASQVAGPGDSGPGEGPKSGPGGPIRK